MTNPKVKTRTINRSLSPCKIRSHALTDYSSGFASYTSGFASHPSLVNRSTSPTRINMYGITPPVRFSIHRSTSPGRPITHRVVRNPIGNILPKKTCMCSPTTHPGSFRCSFHKKASHGHGLAYPSNRLNAQRSAMTNSLVRIGTVEGDFVKRALAALIRPSSHQQRRKAEFNPKPSRLSIMSNSEDL